MYSVCSFFVVAAVVCFLKHKSDDTIWFGLPRFDSQMTCQILQFQKRYISVYFKGMAGNKSSRLKLLLGGKLVARRSLIAPDQRQ